MIAGRGVFSPGIQRVNCLQGRLQQQAQQPGKLAPVGSSELRRAAAEARPRPLIDCLPRSRKGPQNAAQLRTLEQPAEPLPLQLLALAVVALHPFFCWIEMRKPDDFGDQTFLVTVQPADLHLCSDFRMRQINPRQSDHLAQNG